MLLAVLIAAPFLLESYLQSQLVFVFIYAIVGVALMILTGFTGQASLGHAAFLAIGAYTAGFLQSLGVPFIVYFPVAAILTGVVGALVGFPALRLTGIYLVIATIAFAFIVEEVLARWESVTHGNEGMRVRALDLVGMPVPRDSSAFYFLCLLVLVGSVLVALNLLRSPTGRAFVAIRDSETAGKSMGIDLAAYKVKSFAISAAITGMAGVLFAHKMTFICTRDVHPAALHRIHHGDHHRRRLRRARRDPGRDLHGHGRSVPDRTEGRRPGAGGQHRLVFRHGRGCGEATAGKILEDRLGRRPQGRDLRPHHHDVHPVRALRPLRPLAQGEALLPALPALQARHLQAAEDLREVGAQPMSLFTVDGISLQFGGLKAVDAVSFSVEKGEIFTIIGPNGAGKTSIFNLISRLYNPTSGKLFFEGRDITEVPPHQIAKLGIARTFQNIELFENATMLANLLVGRHCHATTQMWQEMLFLPSVRRAERDHRRKVEEVIEFLDLQAYREKLIAGLPYGVRKVIEVARALCSEPKLILLDEPSSGLNVEETDDMSFWIRDIRSELGITVLMVEHDMTLVNRVSDRVLALNYGKVLASGTPAEVQAHPDVIAAYLGA